MSDALPVIQPIVTQLHRGTTAAAAAAAAVVVVRGLVD